MSSAKLEQAKRKWEEKLASYEYELAITSSAPQKFELRERIQECQEEIKRINASLKSLEKDNEFPKNDSSEFTPSQSKINSENKFDYAKLQKLLAAEQWKEADKETFSLMLKIVSCEEKNFLDIDDIRRFPGEELQKIDKLWLTYSKYRFGFSIQKKIWLNDSVSGSTDADIEAFRRFGDCVGWRKNGRWLDHKQLLPSPNSPNGHLPWSGWGDMGQWKRWRLGYLLARNELQADSLNDNLLVFSSPYLPKTNSTISSNQEMRMKKITWLHLSDWHQKGEEFGRRVLRDRLIEDLTNRAEISPDLAKIDFIVFSGDLANSGSRQEYEAAKSYLLDPVLKATNLKPDKLFFVPGNHDFDRSKFKFLPTEIRQPFQSETEVNGWLDNQESRNEVLKPFKAYKEFITQYNNQKQPDYASVQILEINDKKVGLLGINSALMTARNKDGNGKIADQGFLVIGEPQIHDFLQSIEDCEIKIAVLHHPFDWLTEFDRRRIKRLLGESCHFILCGHEHQSRVDRVNSTDGDYIFIPAGASYDRPNFPNSYNFVHLNFDNGKGTVYFRKWSRDRTKWIRNEDAYNNGQFEILSLPKQLNQRSVPK